MNKIFSIFPVMKKIAPAVLVAVFLLPLPARAEIKAGSVELSPFAGYTFFENRQNLEHDFIYGGRLGYNITSYFGIEGVGKYVSTGVDDKSVTSHRQGRFISPIDDVHITSYHLDLLFHLIPEGSFNPFIAAGYGANHYHPEINNKNMSVINFGVGAKVWLADQVALRLDLRDNLIIDERIHNPEATLGLVFAFGGKSAAREQSPIPVAAAVVTPPPTVVFTAPVTTASAADTTPPTVIYTSPVNGTAAAPLKQPVNITFSENMDPGTLNAATFSLKQGAAQVEGKVTAVASTATFAPAKKLEQGKEYTATVTTGVTDLAGNRMANEHNWKFTAFSEPKVVGVLVALQNSHFDFDSAEISENGKTILNSNIAALKAKPDMQIRIVGHTSAAGSVDYNQLLSERRAESVKTYLVKGGIDANRLSTIGYSEKYPAQHEADSNDKLSSAALANMRVVLEIIEEQ